MRPSKGSRPRHSDRISSTVLIRNLRDQESAQRAAKLTAWRIYEQAHRSGGLASLAASW
jgi:hypothetical protein